MNNHEKGKQLEEYVAERLQELFQESPAIRATKASSGGSHNTEIGDILSSHVFVECKNNEKGWFKKSIWANLLNSIPFGSMKIPLYVVEDEIEGKVIMMSFEDFYKLMRDRKND